MLLDAALEDETNWPTCLSGDYRSGSVSEATAEKNARPLTEAVSAEARGAAGRGLNPAWVELHMGFAPGWTEPPAGPVLDELLARPRELIAPEPSPLGAFPGFPARRRAPRRPYEPPLLVPLPGRLDPAGTSLRRLRIHALGNAVIPAVAEHVGAFVVALSRGAAVR